MKRIDELFEYLRLLNDVNAVRASSNFSVEKAIVRTCKEIEKELGMEEPSGGIYQVNVETKIENHPKVTNEMIERALDKFPKFPKA